MSVRERIEDAKHFWRQGRKEGAFIMILLAAAATSRKRYLKAPKGVKGLKIVPDNQRPLPGEYANDGNSFRTFILDEMDKITGGPKYNVAFPFQGRDKVPLEEILYEPIRNHMVHEAGTPPSIEFTESVREGDKSSSVIRLRDPWGFPERWMWNLAEAVAQAPENRDLFWDYRINKPTPAFTLDDPEGHYFSGVVSWHLRFSFDITSLPSSVTIA